MKTQPYQLIKIFIVLGAIAVVSACSSASAGGVTDLPTGVASHGKDLFLQSVNGAPSCITCHTLDGSTGSGPSIKGFSTRAGTRVSGLSAADYTYQSIVQPATHITEGYANVMYTQYQQVLSKQDIADLVAYLLTQ